MSRDQILARYRMLRNSNVRHHTAALEYVSGPSLISQGKRLGLVKGKTFLLNDEDEMTFVCDLVIYTAPAGGLRAIDRYATSVARPASSDDDQMLCAMQNARFSLWRVERKHETAGLVVRDLIRDVEWWLIDEGLEASARIGMCIALRLFQMPDGFAMSCGAFVAVDENMIELVFDDIGHLFDKRGEAAADDRSFAESFYQIAVLKRQMDEAFGDAA